MDQLVDSKQEKLQLQDIVRIAAKNTKSKYNFNQVFLSIMKELTMKGSIVIQLGNTIFVIHRAEDPSVGYFRALNADTAQNYMDNAEQFAKIAYNKYHLDTIVSDYTDPSITNIFEYVGRNKPADMGFKIQKSTDGETYRAIAKLGPPRGAQ